MKRIALLIAFAFLLSSCAHVISKQMREQAREDVPFSAIRDNIDQYKGTIFILGGIIASTKNTEEGSLIEVVQTPLDAYGSVIEPDSSEGRFLAIYKGYLDPLIYKKGRAITLAGKLIGTKKKEIEEIEYVFPLFEVKEMYLWRRETVLYPATPYAPYWYRYPWWYEPWWHRPAPLPPP